MIEFKPLTIDMNEKIESFSEFASSVIKDYYDPIIGADQNDYMIKMFQSSDAIKRQLNDGHTIIMVNNKDKLIGYIAFYEKEEKLYLDKFISIKITGVTDMATLCLNLLRAARWRRLSGDFS